MVFGRRQGWTLMGVKWLLVEFSRELGAAEAPVIQAEPQNFQAKPPVDCPKPGDFRCTRCTRCTHFFKAIYARVIAHYACARGKEKVGAKFSGSGCK